MSYQWAAIAASVGVTSLAIVATYLRFSWHLQDDGMFPWGEMFGTLALVAGGVVGAACGSGAAVCGVREGRRAQSILRGQPSHRARRS